MSKHKFRYNPETLSFEKIEVSVRNIFRILLTHLLSGIGISIIVLVLVFSLIDSPKEKHLRSENNKILTQYKILNKRYHEMEDVLDDIRQRDKNLYRVIMEADSMPDVIRNDNPLYNKKYDEFLDMDCYDIIFKTSTEADYIEQRICQQSSSFNEIADLLQKNSEKLECIPAIQPILNKNLKAISSGFGNRVDPIFRIRRMHTGMDFSAAKGTKVFATGNGIVTEAGRRTGYGNTVVINHGFGYTTVYAHLQKINVKPRQKVTRAQVIGTVGSTGKSTGSHLHYEVRYHGTPVNPVNYFFLDLSPAEYDEMIQIASNAGKVLD